MAGATINDRHAHIGLTLVGVAQGAYMLADGARVLLTGAYFGSTLGPWAALVRALGVDPYHLGPVFVVLGLAWIAAVIAIDTRVPYARRYVAIVAVLSLWYVPFGTLLSLIALALVAAIGPRRAGIS